MSRIRVGILFGGRSGEHEVSLASASSILQALDLDRYAPVPIGITREGEWLLGEDPQRLLMGEVIAAQSDGIEALPDMSHHAIVPVKTGGGIDLHETAVDVVFPVLHGPFGEDGTIQGLLKAAGIPFVGSSVLGSAVSMDKAMMKAVFAQAGLPGVPHQLVIGPNWMREPDVVIANLEAVLTYPMFVKPCNLGSSVGINKAHNRLELQEDIDIAVSYDRRILVEQGVEAREVECGVLGNHDPMVSVPGEIRPRHEFYDYEAKYCEGLADLIIPAPLTQEQTLCVQELARRAFGAVDAAGLARVDFFIEHDTGRVLVNEINTMPGFTSTSMYPKLWEASGVSYPELIDRLIQLAIERHMEDQALTHTR